MKDINKLEVLVASWYKDIPHLPAAGQKWLAENVWWLALIGVIFGAFSVFGIISVTFFASAALVALGGAYGAAAGGVVMLATLFYLALAIITLILMGMAITPLKAGLKKGWTLLFIVALVNVVSLIVSFLTSLNFFGLVWGLLATAVGTYFLFEIRGYFTGVAKVTSGKPAAKKTV